ncbi:MAG: hypothetical protein IPK69_09235 [Phycisphaerales bacterium]|nr:MAG: hypothetical protein IPK69_09235 [Phycisphaerales bacterium]
MSNIQDQLPGENAAARPALPGMFDLDNGKKKRMRGPSQLVMLLIVGGVSAAALMAMRQLGLRSGMNVAGANEALGLKMVSVDSEKAKTYQRIMEDLYRVQKPLDVALGEFVKSPFVLTPAVGAIATEDPTKTDFTTILAEREKAAKMARVQAELAKLVVQSVLGGRSPVARINGETVRVGDTVGEIFTVVSIEGLTVKVETEGKEYELKFDQINGSGTKKK